MPEYTTLDAPDTGFKFPPWLMIGGGITAFAAVIYFVSKGGGSTTAAGTSINAALGSIQEQNLNLLGNVQRGNQATEQGFQALTTLIQNQGVTLTQTIQTQTDLINQNMNSNNAGVLSAISGALGRLLTGQQQLTTVIQGGISQSQQNVISQLQANEATTLSTIMPQIQALLNLTRSGASQNQINALQDSILRTLTQQQQAFQQSINGLGGRFVTNNPFEGAWIWMQAPGAGAGQASIFHILNGVPVGVSWAQFSQMTGLQAFPGVGNAGSRSGFFTVQNMAQVNSFGS